MAVVVTTTVTTLLHPPFWLYRKLKFCWRKNIRIREKIIYTTQLSGFKIPSLNFGFKISGDMTKPGSSYFGFVYLCVNQSGSKTFRINHESGTISLR